MDADTNVPSLTLNAAIPQYPMCLADYFVLQYKFDGRKLKYGRGQKACFL
jgi:hypothetical protein